MIRIRRQRGAQTTATRGIQMIQLDHHSQLAARPYVSTSITKPPVPDW